MKLADKVKATAQSKGWTDVIGGLCNIGEELLDSKHHPCPKCGGTDRFRVFDDFNETGGCICNQCGSHPDGISFASWFLGVTPGEAINRLAEFIGVEKKARKNSKKEHDPSEGLVDVEWNEQLAKMFCESKPGTNELGLVRSGARFVQYHRKVLICWDIFSPDLRIVCGHVLADPWGNDMPIYSPSGEIVGSSKYKITFGSGQGLVGGHAIDFLRLESAVSRVWKVEGISDLVAMSGLLPEGTKDVVITNSSGAGQNPGEMARTLSRAKEVIVIHDADRPGQNGAQLWGKRIAEYCSNVKVVQLPYPISDSHGKDLRDWIREGNLLSDLLLLVDRSDAVQIERTKDGVVKSDSRDLDVFKEKLNRLQLDVLYENDKGAIRVYSKALRKASWIQNIGKLTFDQLAQIGQIPVLRCVTQPGERETVGQLTMSEVRIAIATLAASRRWDDQECGIGCWRGKDDFGEAKDSVVLVNSSSAARWNGDSILKKIESPRDEGLVFDFGSCGRDWFDHDELAKLLEMAGDVQWRIAVLERTKDFFAQWKWSNESCPLVMVGLVLASWVQTLWNWRPLVAISGESGSGKSYLFESLGGSDSKMGIFGRLAFRSSKSTEAGLRQATANKAHIILCDEFEASKERERILQGFRAGSRGDARVIGGQGGSGAKQFSYRHIAWVAAIETGLIQQADSNRFISLDLVKPPSSEYGKISEPSEGCYELGKKLLAIAIRCYVDSEALVRPLASFSIPGADYRTKETFAVPAAILASGLGFSLDQAQALMSKLLESQETDQEVEADQEAILGEILAATVHSGPQGKWSVERIITSDSCHFDVDLTRTMEASGVRVSDFHGILVHCKTVIKKLLPEYRGSRLDKVLIRIPGSKRVKAKFSGRSVWCVAIPKDLAISCQ